jgi:AcrR family transcriptional regulator
MGKRSHPKPRLTRQGWIDAAIQQLVEAGIGAVRVEQLATRLGVTRGSFYHHFADREDLLRAMLEDWAQRWTYEVREQINALGLDASTTLFALMKAIRNNRAADYDAPFRAWASPGWILRTARGCSCTSRWAHRRCSRVLPPNATRNCWRNAIAS